MLTHLGKFEIVRLLAQGSMGEVFVGRDPIIGREVAIKVIHTHTGLGAEARERFKSEARAAGMLNHPNIVTVHEMGEEQGVLYLAMELVKGEDLGTLIRAGTLTPRDTLEVLAQVCDGLAVAHRHQILHRDIKPSNIRVLWDGKSLQAKVLDFGVAKILDSDTTDQGTVVGTVNYMAPEYLQSGRPDSRSDLFAVGVLLYEALSGLPPFDGPTPGAVIYRLLHETPAPLPPTAFRGISRQVQALLDQALAKDPGRRFQSAEELASALRAAKDSAWREGEGPAAVQERSVRPSNPSDRTTMGPMPPHRSPVADSPKAAASRTDSETAGRSEVGKDVLETTQRQLLHALAIDPANARTHALLLVTFYRLGRLEALMQHLRQARQRGLSPVELKAVPRLVQVIEEEERTYRLPLELHGEFMAYLGE